MYEDGGGYIEFGGRDIIFLVWSNWGYFYEKGPNEGWDGMGEKGPRRLHAK